MDRRNFLQTFFVATIAPAVVEPPVVVPENATPILSVQPNTRIRKVEWKTLVEEIENLKEPHESYRFSRRVFKETDGRKNVQINCSDMNQYNKIHSL